MLAFQRTAEDVPGYLIPDIYRQYYLTGVVTDMLVRVFYHNLEDIVSMPLLAARMARFFGQEELAERLAELHAAGMLEPGALLRRAGLGRGGDRRVSHCAGSASGGPERADPARARVSLQAPGAA